MIDLNAVTIDGQSSASASSLPVRQLGPYRVLELLGSGGMGQVFLGEQDAPRRQVALKLMLQIVGDVEGQRRFQREMEALARLDHPGIARLFEVGTQHINGIAQPWYAMEYVAGVPLDAYVREHALDHAQIMALVAQIARALHYAHQRGVIHRDIKPGNILVANGSDGAPQPKILDFGIARLADAESARPDTRFGQIMGTLAYMSPEQLASGHAVDVRSDVYALGVVLYQLLSGQLPVTLSTTSLLDAIRELSEAKRKPLGAIDPRFRGDIELIAETASHPDLERRYESAASMADDLDNFLGHRPLRARRASNGYILRKFVRRNPSLVGALVLAALALFAATLWSMRAANLARQAQQHAEQQTRELTTVNSFVTRMLSEADPDQASSGNLSMKQVLAGAYAAYEQLPDEPGVRVSTALLLSRAARGNGDAQTALKYADQALAALASSHHHAEATNDRQRQEARVARWVALNQLERFADVVAETEAEQRSMVPPEPDDPTALMWLKTAQERVTALTGLNQLEAALKASEALQPVAEALLQVNAEDEFASAAIYSHGVVLRRSGRLADAEAVFKNALQQSEKQGLAERPRALHLRHALALAMSDQGRFDEAIVLNDQVIEARRRLLGEAHPSTLVAELARLTNMIGKKDLNEAAAVAAVLMPRAERTLGLRSGLYLNVLQSYAYLLEDLGQLPQAETVARQVLAAHAERGSAASQTLGPRNNLAMLLARLQRGPEALQWIDGVLSDARSAGAERSPSYGIFLSNAGYIETLFGSRTRAVDHLEAAVALLSSTLGDSHPRVAMAKERLAAAR